MVDQKWACDGVLALFVFVLWVDSDWTALVGASVGQLRFYQVAVAMLPQLRPGQSHWISGDLRGQGTAPCSQASVA